MKKSRFLIVFVIAFAAAFTAGLAAEARPLDTLTADELAQRLTDLQHSPLKGAVKEKDVDNDGYCIHTQAKFNVVDPISGQTKQLTMTFRRPDLGGNNKLPLVIIIPNLDGVSILEKTVSSQLCENDIASVIADVNDNTQPQDLPAWGHEDKNNRFAVLALRTVLDYVENNANYDATKIGMMGLSLGGITTAMMAGIEPQRLRAVVIAVGGANLPYTLANSDNSKVTKLRKRRMEFLKLGNSLQYEDELRKSVKFDPYYFVPRAEKDRILMIMGQTDTKVPYLVQQELHQALGSPQSMVFPGGHVDTLISMVFSHMNEVIGFMQSRFEGNKGHDNGQIPLASAK